MPQFSYLCRKYGGYHPTISGAFQPGGGVYHRLRCRFVSIVSSLPLSPYSAERGQYMCETGVEPHAVVI